MGTNRISGTAKAIVVKVCTQVGYVTFQHNDNRRPLKEAWRDQGHTTHFYFDARSHILGTAKARVAKFCMQVEYIKC